MTTGEHIKAAMDRAQRHQFEATRALRVRIMTQWSGSLANRTGVTFTEEWTSPGLLIRAHLSSRNMGDIEKQGSRGDLGVCERALRDKLADGRQPIDRAERHAHPGGWNDALDFVEKCIKEVTGEK